MRGPVPLTHSVRSGHVAHRSFGNTKRFTRYRFPLRFAPVFVQLNRFVVQPPGHVTRSSWRLILNAVLGSLPFRGGRGTGAISVRSVSADSRRVSPVPYAQSPTVSAAAIPVFASLCSTRASVFSLS